MAGGWLKRLTQKRGLAVEIRTAGVAHSVAGPGRVKQCAIDVMAEVGIDINDDYPKPATEWLEWADIVIPLDDWVRDKLCDRCPAVEAKIRCLEDEVLDPVGCPIETYRERRDQLEELLTRFLDHLPVE
jgi:protein-tyrosine-phosphatase